MVREARKTSGSGRRRWPFRLVALALPLVAVIVAELVLRVVGYGYPAGFFVAVAPGQLKENPHFTRRFFPPGLARTPQPTLLNHPKPAGVYRIFVLGESAAMGDPDPSYGFARMLEVLLEARYLGVDFEVINVAVTAINSHVIREIAKACADEEGDLWVLYMGNNEVVGPFGAGTVFGEQVPGLGVIRASIGLKATRLGQWVAALNPGGRATPSQWGGMEMFLEQQVTESDPRMKVVYEHYRRNLEEIIELGVDSGAEVVVGTVVSNLKDCPPFGSVHSVRGDEEEMWRAHYERGRERERAGDAVGAIQDYQEALKIDDGAAELHFCLARCYLATGKPEKARRSFVRARDLDALRFRVDSRLNDIVREVAGNREAASKVHLVDLEAISAGASPQGLTGAELLYEHVHLNFQGNFRVARALVSKVTALLPERIRSAAGRELTAEECGERLAWTEWDRNRVMTEMVKRLDQPPFSHQLDHEAEQERRRSELRARVAGSKPVDDLRVYESALAWRSEDWILRENAARFLEGQGNLAEAEVQWRKVNELMPGYAEGQYGLGANLDRQGRSQEALPFLIAAVRLRPGSAEARTGLGLALSSLGRTEEAKSEYERVILERPDFVQARINLGQLRAREGDLEGAMAQYRAALNQDSNSVAAHINAGKLLAEQGNEAEALAHYQTAVQVDPGNAVAHYNLGNALSSQRLDEEALQQYTTAVRLNPRFVAARYNLGLALSEAKRNEEAEREFEEVLALDPEFVEARLNLGVALAKQGHLDRAAQAFRETLRRDPNNADAKRFLEQATSQRR